MLQLRFGNEFYETFIFSCYLTAVIQALLGFQIIFFAYNTTQYSLDLTLSALINCLCVTLDG